MEPEEDSLYKSTVLLGDISSLKIPNALFPSDINNSSSDFSATAATAATARLTQSPCSQTDASKAARFPEDDQWVGLRRRAALGIGSEGQRKEGTAVNGHSDELKDGESTAESKTSDDKTERKKKKFVSSPVHMHLKDSPLSSAAIFKQSHAGLVNLCVVVLVAVNSRLILENVLKYGLLVRANFWFAIASWRDWPLLVCGLSLNVFPILAVMIEWLGAYAKAPKQLTTFLHTINVLVEFFYPCIVICSLEHTQFLGSFALIFITVVTLMKLISYAHTNYDLRTRAEEGNSVQVLLPGEERVLCYPQNLTLGNMLYFVLAPTLCYQLGYPRTKEIRKAVMAQHIAQLLAFLCLMIIIIEQYITPTILNSKHPFKGHLLESAERVLRLSLPSLYMWLCVFYTFFHLCLNIMAELLRFGDRDFYRDWWNARTIEEYWRLWNMPVHRWMSRHVYFPLLNSGSPKVKGDM